MAMGASSPGAGAADGGATGTGETSTDQGTGQGAGSGTTSTDQGQSSGTGAQDDSNSVAYWRRQAEKHEKALKAQQRAALSDAERFKLERDEAVQRAEKVETQSRQFLINSRLEAALLKAGSHDPEAAARLADFNKITVTEEGQILGIDTAVADLKRNKQYLFGPPQRPAVGSPGGIPLGGGNGSSSGGGTVAKKMDAFLRKQAGF